jgi:ABC-type sugar transport system permease subunit
MKNTQKSSFSTAKRKENIFYWVMVALPVLQFVVFYIVVNFNSFLLAFKSYKFNSATLHYDQSFVGFDNFKDFLNGFFSTNGNLGKILTNSLIVYATNLFVGTVLALFFSYYIYKKVFMSSFFRVVLFMPSIISAIVLVTLYKYFVDRAVPMFMNKLFETPYQPLLDKNYFETVLFYNVFISFGASVLMYTGAMSRIPDGVIEAGKIDGVGPLREFFVLVLQLIAPTVSTFLIDGVAGLFTNEAQIYAFSGYWAKEEVQTLGYYLLVQVMGQNSTLVDYPYAAAAGLSLAFVAAPLTLLVRYVLEKVVPTVEY